MKEVENRQNQGNIPQNKVAFYEEWQLSEKRNPDEISRSSQIPELKEPLDWNFDELVRADEENTVLSEPEKPTGCPHVLEEVLQIRRLTGDLFGKIGPGILRNLFNDRRYLSKEKKMSRRFPLWQLMTGRQFNELSKGMRFYKLTTANELHRDGLNVDPNDSLLCLTILDSTSPKRA